MDYICDWARDIYRPAVLEELRLLACPDHFDHHTTYTDTDIFSSRDRNGSQDEDFNGFEDYNDAVHAFQDLDSRYGAVRHAAFMESKFRALIITRDNIQTLLGSIDQGILEAFCRRIIAQIHKKQTRCTSRDLDAFEKEWTGKARIVSPIATMDITFYTLMTVNYYLNVSWGLVRQLSVVALEEDAFDLLLAGSGFKPGGCKAHLPLEMALSGQKSLRNLSSLKRHTAEQNLLAAILRLSISAVVSRIHVVAGSAKWQTLKTEYEPEFFRDDEATSRDIVEHVYRFFKKGRYEPDEPFLRLSESNCTQITKCKDPGIVSSVLRLDEHLVVSSLGSVLIHAAHPRGADGDRSSLCLYLVNEDFDVPNHSTLASILKTTFENFDVYHTTRDNGRPNLRVRGTKTPWNIESSYGVHFPHKDIGFGDWLSYLGASSPLRQGSPQGDSLSWNIFGREYSPWQDSRKLSQQRSHYLDAQQQFHQNLRSDDLILWRNVARERNERGGRHCAICAIPLKNKSGSCAICCSHITLSVLEKDLVASINSPEFKKRIQFVAVGFEQFPVTKCLTDISLSGNKVVSMSIGDLEKLFLPQGDGYPETGDSLSTISKPARAVSFEALKPPALKRRKLNAHNSNNR